MLWLLVVHFLIGVFAFFLYLLSGLVCPGVVFMIFWRRILVEICTSLFFFFFYFWCLEFYGLHLPCLRFPSGAWGNVEIGVNSMLTLWRCRESLSPLLRDYFVASSYCPRFRVSIWHGALPTSFALGSCDMLQGSHLSFYYWGIDFTFVNFSDYVTVCI